MTKTFKHPITGQLVIITHNDGENKCEVRTEIKRHYFREIRQDITTCFLHFETAEISEACFRMFDKDCAAQLVNIPDTFRAYMEIRVNKVLRSK